jgi:hypothetical protein
MDRGRSSSGGCYFLICALKNWPRAILSAEMGLFEGLEPRDGIKRLDFNFVIY